MSPKVQAAVEVRLGQLGEAARDLVGLAATIGREFTTDVLGEAGEVDEDTLVRGLDELWRRRIVRERGADAYDFSHDKIREVAYLALSPAQRRRNHLRVAQAVERLHADDPGPVSGQIAAHYERAGVVDRAIAWYERAAETAQQLHANAEALRLLGRALDLLRTLPETPARRSRELDLLTALLTPLGSAEGWASERLGEVQRRALDHARALGVEPAPPLLRSLAFAGLSRRDFVGARGFGERLRARGERDGDDMLVVEGDYMLGIAAFWQGELDVARRHFDAAVQRYRPEHRRPHLVRYGLDPKVICLSRLGNTLWFLGRPGAAIQARDAALALADEIGHPFSRGTALVFAALLALDMGETERLRAYAAMLTAGRGEETTPTRVAAEAIAGYVEVLDGRTAVGIARIERALDETPGASPMPGGRACLLRLLLEACAVAGDARRGLAAADLALDPGEVDRLWEAETRRLRAEFLAALGAPAREIEAELGRALEVARRQGARSLELRVATSLLRRRLERGDGPGVSQARERLAAIVAGFAEGGGSRDLREAVAILGRT